MAVVVIDAELPGTERALTMDDEAGNAIRVRIRQGPKHEPIDHAEHRGIHADAESEGEDHGEREAGRSRDLPHRKTEIPAQPLQPHPVGQLVAYVLHQCHVAKLAAGQLGSGFGVCAVRLLVGRSHRQVRFDLGIEVSVLRSEKAGPEVHGVDTLHP